MTMRDTLSLDQFTDLLDRHGVDFSCWPDPVLAAQARRQIVASREYREAYAAARDLDALLVRHFNVHDALIEAGTLGRVEAAVMRRIGERVPVTMRWLRNLAAGLVLAMLLGGGFAFVIESRTSVPRDVLVAESLVFGGGEVGLR